jgi:low temperature requirement protein LtrA
MFSRLTMTAQYLTIMWNIRMYRAATVPIAMAAGVHFVAAVVYLGTAFGFQGGSSALWVIWIIVTVFEAVLQVVFSLKWTALSFRGTHLCQRISLLSFILMGEGIITVCLSVGRIVVNANQWSTWRRCAALAK